MLASLFLFSPLLLSLSPLPLLSFPPASTSDSEEESSEEDGSEDDGSDQEAEVGLTKRKKATPMSAPPTKRTKTEENGESKSWSFSNSWWDGREGKGRGDEMIGSEVEGRWDDARGGRWSCESCTQV